MAIDVARFAIPLTLILLGNMVQRRQGLYGAVLRVLGFLSLSTVVKGADFFSDMLVISSIAIGVVIAAYTLHYSYLKYGNPNLAILVDMFLLTMILVFTSENLIEFITFWLSTELLGFFLIAYDYIAKNDVDSMSAAIKYLLFSMIPTDIALFVLLALTGFTEAVAALRGIGLSITDPVVLTMVLLGFFSKAAIFPLHFWLPDAHSVAPSPASALLSGLMVKMGIYALYIMSFYQIDRGLASSIMLLSGLLTAVYGAMQAIVQHDIKRILAYSTTSETALITVVIALYMISSDRLFIEAAILYTVAHAVYKASLFMDSGFIELTVHERDVRRLGYIASIAPTETVAVFTTIVAALGMPPSVGFLAKLFTFAAISRYLSSSWIYIAVLVIASIKVALSIIYNMAYLRAHLGGGVQPHHLDIDGGVLRIRVSTFAASLLSFVMVAALYIMDCSGYVELEMFRKLTPLLAVSLALLTIVGYSLYEFIIYGVKR